MRTKVLFLILLSLLISPATTSSVVYGDAPDLLEQAASYLKVGAYLEAEQLYKDVIAGNPGTDYAFQAQRELTIMYISMGELAQAKVAIDGLTIDFAGHPGLSGALYNIAKMYEDTRNHQEAEGLFRSIIADYPGSKDALWSQKHLVLLYSNMGNEAASQETLDRLIVDFGRHPDLADVLLRIGKGFKESGRYQQAEGIFRTIVETYTGTENTTHALWAQKYLVTSSIQRGELGGFRRPLMD